MDLTTGAAQYREPPVAILTVCTGNICRSPLAEQMLRLRLDGDPRFEIASAGLQAVVGASMDPDAAQLQYYGGDSLPPRGEQLVGGHAEAADLILTMTRAQRDELLRRFPKAMHRTFTLAEFVILLRHQNSASHDPRAIIAEAALSRGAVLLTDDDDVPDPIDASSEVHAAVAAQIIGLVDVVAARLR